MRTLRFACYAVLFLASVFTSSTARAQSSTIEIQNGAKVIVQNGSVVDLKGGSMELGDTGATTRLDERGESRVTGGQVNATRALDRPSAVEPAGIGVEISSSVDLGDVTIVRGHTAQSGGGNQSIRRYVDISPSNVNAGLDATLTFEYRQEELNGLAESQLEFFKSTDRGGSWTPQGRSSQDQTANTVTLDGVSSFSRWTLGASSEPLPVELASFRGRLSQDRGGLEESTVQLIWKTTSEQNNAGFQIQRRRKTTGTWEQIGYRESKVAGGSTTDENTYRFTDTDLPYKADTLRYRLRQMDADGSGQVTDPVAVARAAPGGLELLVPTPNPASQKITVRYGLPKEMEAEARLRFYDVLGRVVRSVRLGTEPGRHNQVIDVSGLANGTYFLRVRIGGQTKTRKLTVVR